MKSKYKKFNQYFRSCYYGSKFGYLPVRTWKATQLIYSQTNTNLSDKMKKFREDRKWTKNLHDREHRVNQQYQRLLRESKKIKHC